jgi:hypothetical protein
MTISNESLEAFIDAYEHGIGERLTHDEALDAAHRVLAFIELLSASPAKAAQTGAPAPEDPQATHPLGKTQAEFACPL